MQVGYGVERWPVEAEPNVRHVGTLVAEHPGGGVHHLLQQRLLGRRQGLGVADVLLGHDQVVMLRSRFNVPENDNMV